MKTLKTRRLLLFIFCMGTTFLQAQSIEERLAQKKPSCRDVLANAGNLLPELYAQKAFDSLDKAITFIHNSCSDIPQVFYLTTLLAIQRPSILMPKQVDSNFIELLNDYALRLAMLKTQNAQIYNVDEYKLFSFMQQWATDLLKKNERISANERFICNVMAGNIKNPEQELRSNKDTYPQLYALLKQNDAEERNGSRATFAFIAGVWQPTKDLHLLGAHPSVGISFGGRNKSNEFDITMQFRFINAKNNYDVLRQNNLYSLNHYFGGYIGLDYTRYFVNATDFELGLLAGAGYDGFDIASSNEYNNYSNDYLKPLSINSFNFNTGLRFNFFINKRTFIGLQSRYNFINYGNRGGTSMHGNAISIDLLIGSNSRHFH